MGEKLKMSLFAHGLRFLHLNCDSWTNICTERTADASLTVLQPG